MGHFVIERWAIIVLSTEVAEDVARNVGDRSSFGNSHDPKLYNYIANIKSRLLLLAHSLDYSVLSKRFWLLRSSR